MLESSSPFSFDQAAVAMTESDSLASALSLVDLHVF